MTAILGYTNRNEFNSIGVLCADDLEGVSQCKSDKLSKFSQRFVTAVTGLEVVDMALTTSISYFEQFSGSRHDIHSIQEFENLLNDVIPETIIRWKKASIIKDATEQLNLESAIVVLDTFENKLFFAELGKVWLIDENPDYQIVLTPLEDGILYSFGVITHNKEYDEEVYQEFDRETIFKTVTDRFNRYSTMLKEYVGKLGAIEINIVGQDSYEKYSSCFPSYISYIENMIKRIQYNTAS